MIKNHKNKLQASHRETTRMTTKACSADIIGEVRPKQGMGWAQG